MFKVKDPEMGIQAARAVVEDAQAFNNAVVSSKVYQSATDPNLITQRIIWTSLVQAKAAFAASEGFANMGTLMGQITEQVSFDHFYHVNQ